MSEKEKPATRWSELRDMFAATREAMIVTAIVMVFLAPSVVRASLERAGITAFAGVEFGVQEVVDANESVAAASEQVSQLAEQLANVESRLETLTKPGRATRPEEIQQIANAVSSMKTKADSVDNSLLKTGIRIDKAIKLIPPEQLRELSQRNARRQEISQQQSIGVPPIQSAQLEGLLIQSQDFPPQAISR